MKRLALAILSLLLFLVVGEVLVRTLTGARRPLLAVDETVGRHYIPNWEGEFYSDESDRLVPLRFNQHGLRFPETPFEKPQGVQRLLVIGDSLIAGLEVNEEDTACVRLQQALEHSRPEERWEVLNFGVSGASTGQELVLYRELASRFDPDVVLCAFFVGNDFGGNSTRLSNLNYIYFDLRDNGELVQVPFPSPRLRFNSWLDANSRLYVWQKKLVNRKRRDVVRAVTSTAVDDERLVAHGNSIRGSEWVYSRSHAGEAAYAWKVTEALIRAFATEVREDGAGFGLVMIPGSEQLYDDDFARVRSVAGDLASDFDPLYPSEMLESICQDLDVPFIDLLPALRAATPSHDRDAEEEWLLFKGVGHLNERGHDLVADVLHQRLTEVGGLVDQASEH